jgi:isopenicillin N synthase-like dioxygenase
VVNIGDMLQRLTNHVLPSTTHRVRNPDGARAGFSRYSMPFFLHLRSDFPFHTLPQCITAENPDRYPVSITADDYLQERLREIGLKM